MRGHCEFNNCHCDEYHGLNDRCLLCRHGRCWHKKIRNKKYIKKINNINQFISPRSSAHKPTYVFAFNCSRVRTTHFIPYVTATPVVNYPTPQPVFAYATAIPVEIDNLEEYCRSFDSLPV